MKSPHILAEEQYELSEQYSKYSGELAQLIKEEAEFYNLNRDKHKSDTAVKKAWTVTEKGVHQTIVELKLKSLSKSMTAIRSLLATLTEEAKGLY